MRTAVLLLVVSAAFAACAPADASNHRIEVGINHSRFDPTHIDVFEGDEVTFVIHNDDPIAHELIVGDETVQEVHEEGTEAHHGARPGEVSVAAGETATTTYRFGAAGELIFGCHLPGHYSYGMRGTITIAPRT